ncbi:hypothetical protein ACWGID_19465 [Kribbella sp. NPDC054772]
MFDGGSTDRLVRLRRALHARPELGFTEVITAATVVRLLEPVADAIALGRDVLRLPTSAGVPGSAELADARRRAGDAGVPDELVELPVR